MNKLLLFLFVVSGCFAQAPVGNGIELRLTDADHANDATLLNILNAHNVDAMTQFLTKAGHPVPELVDRVFQITYADDFSTLLADLTAYTEVVELAVIVDNYVFTDVCNAQLLSADTGIPIGFEDNIVITNDTGLNNIFEAFNVYYYVQTYPGSTWESTLRYYAIACDCDAQQLQDALAAYDSVIEATEDIPAAYLSNTDFKSASVKVYPNPFSAELRIESQEDILGYTLYDSLGKLVLNTSQEVHLQSRLQGLAPGVYVLNLQFAAGVSETRKVVKQ